jgi:tetratricopeptide (TPR) repeat protein
MNPDTSTDKEQEAINWYNKGNALVNLGRYEEALKAHEKAIVLKPDDAGDWVLKSFLLCTIVRIENIINKEFLFDITE